jgi:phosphate transport system substrate-binding protein
MVAVALVATGVTFGTHCASGEKLRGTIRIDGSSTVFPITEAVAEEYAKVQPRVRVTVGVSGTGGGFKKFVASETDINDASRPIKPSEREQADKRGLGYIELPVAYDGLTVVINPQNDFVDHLTVAELHKIWMPESQVKTWADVRPGWPARTIRLYGPGTDSGTFDYFTEVINGKSQACRADFTASEDDNVLVQGVAGDVDALGFFGFAYYVENTERVKAVPIDGGQGPVSPSLKSVQDGSYAPLSRPIFIYVTTAAAGRPEVESFVNFYLEQAAQLAEEVGYVALPADIYALVKTRFERKVAGSAYQTEHVQGALADLYAIQ